MAHELIELKNNVADTSLKEAAQLARNLGLEIQAKRWEKNDPRTAFTPLTEHELAVWMLYCPTGYFESEKADRRIANYAFDTIPVEVLRHWAMVKERFAFDSFSIRTTERTQNLDPILLALQGQDMFLLARWGADSPELMPFSKIVRSLYEEFLGTVWRKYTNWPNRKEQLRRTFAERGNCHHLRSFISDQEHELALDRAVRGELPSTQRAWLAT